MLSIFLIKENQLILIKADLNESILIVLNLVFSY